MNALSFVVALGAIVSTLAAPRAAPRPGGWGGLTNAGLGLAYPAATAIEEVDVGYGGLGWGGLAPAGLGLAGAAIEEVDVGYGGLGWGGLAGPARLGLAGAAIEEVDVGYGGLGWGGLAPAGFGLGAAIEEVDVVETVGRAPTALLSYGFAAPAIEKVETVEKVAAVGPELGLGWGGKALGAGWKI